MSIWEFLAGFMRATWPIWIIGSIAAGLSGFVAEALSLHGSAVSLCGLLCAGAGMLAGCALQIFRY